MAQYEFDSMRWCRTMAKAHWMRNEHDISSTFRTVAEEIDALRARVARMEEALTPSAETKAAYMGEFSMNIPEFDENGEEYMRPTNIPWTTIKDIMKAIARRALEEK